MKCLYFIFAVTLIFSCSSVQKVGIKGEKYKISKELNQFLLDFESAARNHKKGAMLNLLDKDYKKEQHDEMLEGRTNQFLNEFFAGYLISESKFKSPGFESIISLNFVSIKQIDENSFDVSYIIKSKDFELVREWEIIIRNVNGKQVYGLVGAFG
ncbi:MAG: hypothetical protein L3J35_09170 [Bacteroidales bacterium]|nr:hypothetical protein [Bacteroidales bacterium]